MENCPATFNLYRYEEINIWRNFVDADAELQVAGSHMCCKRRSICICPQDKYPIIHKLGYCCGCYGSLSRTCQAIPSDGNRSDKTECLNSCTQKFHQLSVLSLNITHIVSYSDRISTNISVLSQVLPLAKQFHVNRLCSVS